jgi:hypothetical protein
MWSPDCEEAGTETVCVQGGEPPNGRAEVVAITDKSKSAKEKHKEEVAKVLMDGRNRIYQAANIRDKLNEHTLLCRELAQKRRDAPSSSDSESDSEVEESPAVPRKLYTTPKVLAKTKGVHPMLSVLTKASNHTTDSSITTTVEESAMAKTLARMLEEDADDDIVIYKDTPKGMPKPVSDCEIWHKDHGGSACLLLAMCYGLINKEGRPLADFEADALYKSQMKKSDFPTVQVLKSEMTRRATAMGMTKLRNKSALRPAVLAWLKEHPVTGDDNLKYLMRAEHNLYTVLRECQNEQDAKAQAKLEQSAWHGFLPWLRLYCCIAEDEAKEALLRSGQTMKRDELDASTDHPEAPPLFEQVVSDLYNDADTVYWTEALPTLHSMFSEPIKLEFRCMPGGKITAETVKSKMAEARAKLVQVSRSAMARQLCSK